VKPFRILHRENICENPWIPVEKQRVELPNGEQTDWYLSDTKEVVILVPKLKTGEILLQRSYKHGAGEIIIEFPAGMVDEGESLETAARRELLEETGYVAKDLTLLGKTYGNPTGSGTRYHFFLAEGCHKIQEAECEETEQIEPFLVKDISEARKILCESLSSSGALAALAFVLNSRDNSELLPIRGFLEK